MSKDLVLKKMREDTITDINRKVSPCILIIDTLKVTNTRNNNTLSSLEEVDPIPSQEPVIDCIALAPLVNSREVLP